MKISVIGAGFSGLTLGYFLTKKGHSVEFFEKRDRSGGLIRTHKDFFGLAETAASGFWNSALLEAVFNDIGVQIATRKPGYKKRFIFRGRPRRWPLTIPESIQFAWRGLLSYTSGGFAPRRGETLEIWAHRIGGSAFADWLLAPAIQGIYAGDIATMSAELILGPRFDKTLVRPEAAKIQGTVSPLNGMGEFISKMVQWLMDEGCGFNFRSPGAVVGDTCVIATNAWDAAEILKDHAPDTAALLKRVESLPIATATLFFKDGRRSIDGFGCLFPEAEKFNSLGVLFNSDIFENRAYSARSETWILGGVKLRNVTELSDKDIVSKILADRKRFANGEEPMSVVIQRWPRALPHYTLELKEILEELNIGHGFYCDGNGHSIYLTGNYLGAIGLSKILEYNKRLAEVIPLCGNEL